MQNLQSSPNFQVQLQLASNSKDNHCEINEKGNSSPLFIQHLTQQEQACYTQDLRKLIQHFEKQFNLESSNCITQSNIQQLNPNICNKLSYLNILSQVTLQKMKTKFNQIKAQTDLKLQKEMEKNEKLKKMIRQQEKKPQTGKPRKRRRTKNSNKAEKLD